MRMKTSLIDFYCDGTKQFAGSWCASTKTSYYQIKENTTEYQTYDDGTNETLCPEINRYRIFGVIDGKVKVIVSKTMVK